MFGTNRIRPLALICVALCGLALLIGIPPVIGSNQPVPAEPTDPAQILGLLDGLSAGDTSLKEKAVMGVGKHKIALISVDGIISDRSTPFGSGNVMAGVLERLAAARDDDDVKAVLLLVNSPGGGVTASDILHHRITELQKAGKKVVVLMKDLAASGGYYISAGADKIVAHPTTLTGSIGVIIKTANMEGLYNKIGVKPVTIKSGDKKDILSSARPMTAEEKKMLQAIVMEMHNRFVQIIVDGRDMKKADVEKVADGRILTAQQALKAKLIDEIGYLEDAFELTKKEAGLKNARLVQYYRPRTLFDIFGGLSGKTDVTIGIRMDLPSLEGFTPKLMYLWSPGS